MRGQAHGVRALKVNSADWCRARESAFFGRHGAAVRNPVSRSPLSGHRPRKFSASGFSFDRQARSTWDAPPPSASMSRAKLTCSALTLLDPRLVSLAFIAQSLLRYGNRPGAGAHMALRHTESFAPCGCFAPALNHEIGVRPHWNPRASPVGRLLVLHFLTHRL